MAFSQTYNFGQNTYVDNFITEAFQWCKIMGPDITGLQVDSAITSLNFMLSEWADKGLNLFTVQKSMFQINVGQPSYVLPTSTIETTEVTAGNNTRLLGGTAFSSAGGIANNAFIPGSIASCIQTAPNGYISYAYPLGYTPAVYYIGIQSNVTNTYTLVYEYTTDGTLWINGLTMGAQFFPAGQLIWFVAPAAVNVKEARIRETGGATLNVQQVYFSQPTLTGIGSRILTAISRSEWTSYPNKTNQASPSSFYLDRQSTPIMTLWPTPDNSFQTIIYNRSVQIMDVTAMTENINIPQRWMNAVRMQLAFEMAFKFAKTEAPELKALSDAAFLLAAREDVENVPMRIQPTISSYT